MARIRSIKPEVWTDPDVVACSPLARLLWIGSWNHADDYGVLKDDPARLKLQILPADQCDPLELVDELVRKNLLLRRVAPDGTRVLVIRTFCVHQKIDSRATGRWGHPDEFTTPTETPGPQPSPTSPNHSRQSPTDPADSRPSPTIRTERSGVEGKGENAMSNSPAPLALVAVPASPPATSRPDVHVVFDAWRESTSKLKAKLDPKRRRRIELALRDYPLEDVIDAVRGWRHSAFHRGQNDRSKPYNELDLLLRDAAHIEQFRDLERGEARASPSEPKSYDAIRRGLARRQGLA